MRGFILIDKLQKQPSVDIEAIINKKGIITFLNPYSYLIARRNVNLFNRFDLILLDGISLVLILRFFLFKKVKRFSFDYTSLAQKVFLHAQNSKQSIYLIGSKEKEIGKSITNIEKEFPNIIFCGYRNGYFQDSFEYENVINEIVCLNPDILIVGMGSPLQEKFLEKIKRKGWKGTGYTCGGFLHQTSYGNRYYPKLIDQLNIRFLYRLTKEPHVRKRHIKAFLKFPFIFLYDYILFIINYREIFLKFRDKFWRFTGKR